MTNVILSREGCQLVAGRINNDRPSAFLRASLISAAVGAANLKTFTPKNSPRRWTVILITNSVYEKRIASPQETETYWLEDLAHVGWQQRNKKGRVRPLLLGGRRIHETALKQGN
jgi:hypothetical protein